MRVACAFALAATMAACEININLVAHVNRDGSGTLSLQFVVDRELVDLARNSGEDPLQAINELVKSFSDAGWTVTNATIGGGIQAIASKRFTSPSDLAVALQQVQSGTAGSADATFFSLRIERSSGFLRTRTALEGSIDLSLDRVLGQTDLPAESRATLQTLIDQAADDFFAFRLRAELPGGVSSTAGDPSKVDGGAVEWAPRLGRRLTFRAETSAYNAGALAGVGIPLLVLLIIGGALLMRSRRRRATPVAPGRDGAAEQAGSIPPG